VKRRTSVLQSVSYVFRLNMGLEGIVVSLLFTLLPFHWPAGGECGKVLVYCM
jgi:hypothetical protein